MIKVALIGTFDVANYGDCFFPDVWEYFIRQRFPEASIERFSPCDRRAAICSFDRLRALPASVDQDMRTADGGAFDALVLCGGETLGAGHTSGTYPFPRDALSAYLRLWLAPLSSAQRSRAEGGSTLFLVHAAGAALGCRRYFKPMARALAHSDWLKVRDDVSAAALAGPDGPIGCVVDPMFALRQIHDDDRWSAMARKALPNGVEPGAYLLVHASLPYVSPDSFGPFVDAVAAIARREGVPVILLPVCHFLKDSLLLDAIGAELRRRGIEAVLLGDEVHVQTTAAIIGHARAVVTTSLHAAVTAVGFERRLIVLAHDPDGKHQRTLAGIGLDRSVAFSPADMAAVHAHGATIDMGAVARGAADAAVADMAGALDAMASGRPMPDKSRGARESIQAMVVAEREEAAASQRPLRDQFHIQLARWPLAKQAYLRARARLQIRKLQGAGHR